jgi:hypothetical protein
MSMTRLTMRGSRLRPGRVRDHGEWRSPRHPLISGIAVGLGRGGLQQLLDGDGLAAGLATAARPQLRDRHVQRAQPGVEVPVPVAVATVHPPLADRPVLRAAQRVRLRAHQCRDERLPPSPATDPATPSPAACLTRPDRRPSTSRPARPQQDPSTVPVEDGAVVVYFTGGSPSRTPRLWTLSFGPVTFCHTNLAGERHRGHCRPCERHQPANGAIYKQPLWAVVRLIIDCCRCTGLSGYAERGAPGAVLRGVRNVQPTDLLDTAHVPTPIASLRGSRPHAAAEYDDLDRRCALMSARERRPRG